MPGEQKPDPKPPNPSPKKPNGTSGHDRDDTGKDPNKQEDDMKMIQDFPARKWY